MNTIYIQNRYEQEKFLKNLLLDNKIPENTTLSNYFIDIDCHNKDFIYPAFCEFVWVYENENFLITYREEGKPQGILNSEIKYFSRLFIQHSNLEKLRKFAHQMLIDKNKFEYNKISIYSSRSKGFWSEINTTFAQPLDKIFISNDIKKNLIDSIDKFIGSQKKYNEFGRLYKISYMLTGVPGSGKTSLVKSIALKYSRKIYVLNFTKELTDEGLIELISEIKDDSILLIEDIDAYFIDRKPQDINISFSTLLNILDGTLVKGNGTLIFITANNPDYIDSALIRPGRVDKIFKFNYPTMKEIESAFYALCPDSKNTDFIKFYDYIKNIRNDSLRVNMSAVIDYLFRNPDTYLDNIEDFIQQIKLCNEITNDKTDKLYN